MKELVYIVTIVLVLSACQKQTYDIEYQNGYPNPVSGNWVAMEFPDLDLNITEAHEIYELFQDLEIFDEEFNVEFYDLVTALDPNSSDSLVIDNIYGSGVRVKTLLDNNSFHRTRGKQLDLINDGYYGIYSVSVNGTLYIDEEQGDAMKMNVHLYDDYDALFDSVYIYAFRKTGFEDIEYKLLSE